ncbi:MAG: hypothetical protein J1G07_01405 [Clostridiales bacterium]|nr:hypothetical protein [Clostridiales bacterium]
MAKFRFKKSKTRKAAIAALCAVAVTCTSLAAACQPNDGSTPDDDTTRAEDTSTLTNGSFEFFNVPDDAVYLIKNVQDWSRSGDSSGTMSGILDTSEKNWGTISSSDLADKLDTNNDLLTSDDKYVDYNGMKSGDIPYKEPYAAKLEESAVKDDKILNKNDLSYAQLLGITEKDGKYTYGEGDDAVEVYFDEETGDFYFEYDENSEEYSKPVRYEIIANPGTHYGSYNEKDGKHYLGDHEIYVDEDGYYYKDEDHEYSEGNVLMIHNYPTDTKYNGIQQYYSSTTITLESRTAAKISVWVKTSNLKFDKGYSLLDEQDRGAFIEVVQTVGGTTIDEFTIKAINTEKILKDNNDLDTNNGWLQYNIYVNACDFAQCTVQLRLGLGKSNGETCTGYAFFDDVEVVKERKIENTGYGDVSAEILERGTYCNLSDEGEDKIFYADKAVKGDPDDRHSKDFNYYIDLASESGTDGYTTFDLEGNITAGLTTEKEDKITYASAKTYEGKTNSRLGTIGATDYSIYKNSVARPTDKDFLGLFTASESFTDSHVADKYIKGLNDALFGDKSFEKLPTHDDTSKMLVTFSAWGAAYTSTVNNPDIFTLNAGEQMILSFWVKTSDITNKIPATVYIYDVEDEDKENAVELDINTTGITTDIEDDKDIYNGWVQCFFFIQNNTKDGTKKFQIDFCFGNTSIISATSYEPGWIALANMQTLKITEEVYNLTATANFTKKFQFSTDDKEKTHKKFADALGTYDITEEIALPDGYNGVNGASSSVSGADYSHYYDIWNTNRTAGLINRDNFFDDDGNPKDWNGFLNAYFSSASQSAANWNEVFGKDCYQPLIIVNNLRRYADNAHANEDTYNNGNYYLLVDDEYTGDFVEDYAGRRYRKVTDEDEFDEEETYYSFKEVVNYGFVGGNKTISSSATEVITVKVMVTEGATAYIYLVDPTTREVMSYSVPGYTFWYDDEGNVLDEEFDEDWDRKDRDSHTVYNKQDNGLYKDENGNYVANLYNLKKIYQKEKLDTYYYKDGDTVKEYRGTKCEDGVDYFLDKECETPAPHRLCNSDDKPIYQYKDGAYYYIVSGKVSSIKVGNFDAKYARYNYDQDSENGESLADTEYCIAVGDTHGKWVTVNFVVKAGNKSKSYRLELWSGKRGESGVTDQTTADNVKGAVAFDYSAYTVSNYDSILRTDDASYEKSIIREYQELLAGHEDEFELDFTIKDYEDLAEKYLSGNAKFTELINSYIAHYYTYSLYDTNEFIPYNQEVAEDGETDYDYTAPDSESLAYFSSTTKDSEGNITSYNTFIDYSAVEKEINKTNAPSDSGSTDDDNDNDNSTAGEFWLQLASILLVVVLLFVLLVLVARIIIKKVRRKLNLKKQSKNVYRQRKRYLRKLHIEEEETEEIDNPALQNSEVTEATVEEVPAEEVKEEVPAETTETPAEEAPTEAPVEEVKEEASAEETPVEEAPAEQPAENSEEKPE